MTRHWPRKDLNFGAFVIVLWLAGIELLAHPPYEREVGWLQRADEVTVSAVKRYVDGILGEDPVSVEFRLGDGTVLAATEYTRETVVIRKLKGGFEVYRFESDLVPIANVLQLFDGFELKDVTTRAGKARSPIVHTLAHLGEYIWILSFIGVFVAAPLVKRLFPQQQRAWRLLGLVVKTGIQTVVGMLVLLLLWVSNISVLVLLVFGALSWCLYAFANKLHSRRRRMDCVLEES